MLTWWYSHGWFANVVTIEKRLQTIGRVFAIKVLLRTWFSPWKQVYTRSTFATFFRDLVDNTVSRVIGAFVRTAILFAALIISIGVIALGIISFIIWPFIPLFIVIFPILAASGKDL